MLYFANPSTERVCDAMRAGLLGSIHTPKQGNRWVDGATWCADNGCFGKGYPGDSEWFAWLTEHASVAATCVFAVAPDVVGDAAATLARSLPWLPKIRALGYPAAFVAQNGQEHLPVPWDEFDALFIGGCVECVNHGPTIEPIKTGRGAHQRFYCPTCHVRIHDWKRGQAARTLVAEAKQRGKKAHLGRVSSAKMLRYAEAIGCDSADGTYIKFGPDRNLPNVLAWLRGTNDQLTLGGVA